MHRFVFKSTLHIIKLLFSGSQNIHKLVLHETGHAVEGTALTLPLGVYAGQLSVVL